MSTLKKLAHISVDEYLDGEKAAEVRHEYSGGAVYAMAGASVRHNLIAGTIAAALRAQVRGSACYVFQSDMKVRIDDTFYYPDIVVTCGAIDLTAYFQASPVLIVEVLSESTEAKDRLEKRVAYQHLVSVKEYALVAQDKLQIEVIRRVRDGWQIETYGHGDVVKFSSVGLEQPIEALYEDVLRLLP